MGQCMTCPKCRRQPPQNEVIVHFNEDCLSQPISDPAEPITLNNQGPSERVLVAAIDIGTTFSGYAFSFRHEHTTDRMRITTHEWPHASGMSMKAPTSILLGPDGEVKEFGYEAKEKFVDLAEKNQHLDHYYFSKFKMDLYKGSLTTDFKLEDINGKTMPAVDVFAKVIWYLKQHLEKQYMKSLGLKKQFPVDDLQWVITVPAIWDDKAKFFMRRAAEKAGIEGRNLTLALEPEAASLYCRHHPTYQPIVHDPSETFDIFKPKNKFMVVDLGGGTVDITVQTVLEDGALEEVYQPTGGPWGGSTVEDEFCALLDSIFGHEVFQDFQKRYKGDMLDLLQTFEFKKRTFQPEKDSPLLIKIPVTLLENYENQSGDHKIQEVLKTKFNEEITLSKDKLRISPQTFKRLFDKSTSSIVKHIQHLLEKTEVSDVRILLLVGGFSESAVVRDAIVSHFPNLQIIHPPDSASTVVKGSVLFGHEPKAIVARMCKYTYGIAMMAPFKEGLSDPKKKRIINGEAMCDDVFDVHLSVGERVSLSDKRAGKEYSLHSEQSHSLLEVYASSVLHPKYVTDSSCSRLGSLVLEVPPDRQENEKILVCLYYSGTELGVSAFNPKTNQKTKTYFDFLG